MKTRDSWGRRLLNGVLGLVAFVAAAPYLLAPIYRFPDPSPFRGSRIWNPYEGMRGQWQRTNLHAHGRAWAGLTSGQQSGEAVAQRYRELGYTVPGVSDYQRIAAQHGVDTLPIYEHGYNLAKQHQLVIGARWVEWFDFPLWQSVSHQQYVIDRLHRSADLVALAHPATRQAYSTDDLQRLTGYDLVEISNGPFSAAREWDVALSSGHPAWAVANDDTHDLHDARRTAAAWNMVDAASPGTADIVDALRRGRTYAVLRTGRPDAAHMTVVNDVSVRGTTLSVSVVGAASTFSFLTQNGAVAKIVENAHRAEYTLADSDPYVRTVIDNTQTVLFLNPVVRYDGERLSAPQASIDAASTWAFRASVALGLIVLTWAYARRRRTALPVGTRSVIEAASRKTA